MDAALLQTLLTVAATVLLSLALGGGGMILVREARARARRGERLSGEATAIVQGGGEARPSSSKAVSGLLTGVRRLGDRLAIQDPAQISVIRMKLIQAGYFNREAVAIYLGARGVAMIAATVGVLMLAPLSLKSGGGMGPVLLAAAFALVAMMGPDHVIKGKRRKLELEYLDGFPDMLDLLVASVEAGLSLDAAVSRVADELVRRYPHLAEHVKILTLELRAGRARKDAWTSLAERLGLDEARQLATMLRQAEEMGTSLGETLAVFSDDMRVKRMLKAEEKAMALPAKLMVPLILFIFPCLLGVLILPAIFRVTQAMAGMN